MAGRPTPVLLIPELPMPVLLTVGPSTVQSPRTQAVIGRAAGKSFALPGVSVTDVKTPFVSLIFTPLDDRELIQSRQVLVTAMARDKQTGSQYGDDGARLITIGAPPLLMEPVQARIAFKGTPPRELNILDIYGAPTGRRVPPAADGSFTIDGTARTFYYEMKR